MASARPIIDTPVALVALLQRCKRDLIERWMRRVLNDPNIPEAGTLSELALRDHIPNLIERIIEELGVPSSHEAAGRAIGLELAVQKHGQQRFIERYALTAALRELSHFRAALLELCVAEGIAWEDRTAMLVHATIDEAMTTVASTMERAHGEEMERNAGFRERFIGILGHDLRSPLSTILMTSAAQLKREGLPEAQVKAFRRIMSSAERMKRMISDLLDLTRSRLGGGIPIEPWPMNLHEVCRQVLTETEIMHPSRSLQFDASGNGEGVWDRDRIMQVVANLISNAITYSPGDSPVLLSARDTDDGVLLEVSNQGTPIPPEAMARLFDPFQRGAQGQRHGLAKEGLGLGLFIVKQIVEAHGGSIEAKSNSDHGTTFTVRLPRAAA